jgi:hypothetical protein
LHHLEGLLDVVVTVEEDLCVVILIEDGSLITRVHYDALLGSLIEERIPFDVKNGVLRVMLGFGELVTPVLQKF